MNQQLSMAVTYCRSAVFTLLHRAVLGADWLLYLFRGSSIVWLPMPIDSDMLL
jgi:hypothetical protein